MSRGEVLRIANCSGFYGDRLSAAREMVEGGPIDILTGDYLAELTLMILHKDRLADPSFGYAKTFPAQLRQIAATCLERGIRIVVNAGGLNPASCAEVCRGIYRQLGLKAKVAHLEGDDLLPRLEELQTAGESFAHLSHGRPLASLKRDVVSANAYLGGWGIAQALEHGADLVICPRVTDASLVLGPAAWRFSWARDDWNSLASAVVAGHILECGAQATGGNYSFWQRFKDLENPGFPIAEMARDGSFTITKHEGTSGQVTVGTVTAQLLYEIDTPRYLGPDVTALFDSIELREDGFDRVRVSGVVGEPPPTHTKVCLNYLGGFKNSVTFLLTGLEIDSKAELAERSLFNSLGGRESFSATHTSLQRAADLGGFEQSFSRLTLSVQDPDKEKVGRRFASAAVEMALASYPGFNLTAPPGPARPYGVYWPALVSSSVIRQTLILGDSSPDAPSSGELRLEIEPTIGVPPSRLEKFEGVVSAPALECPGDREPTTALPLGSLCGARSGDKGGDANLGVWVESEAAFAWLRSWLTCDRLALLIPEAHHLEIDRYELPNLLAVNFVLRGFLGEGVAASLAIDAQAKGLGEFLRARIVPIPQSLLNQPRTTPFRTRENENR